jgi:hypothetical protein
MAKKKRPSEEFGIRIPVPPPNQAHKNKSKYVRKPKRPKEDADE